MQPSGQPSSQPSGQPTSQPTMQPSGQPSTQPSGQPSGQPSSQPSGQPTTQPTMQPSGQPSTQPSGQPSSQPTMQPSGQPSTQPSGQPSGQPSSQPSGQPTTQPTMQPSGQPTMQPSLQPTSQPTMQPSGQPTSQPSGQPSGQPSSQPSGQPTTQPTMQPSGQPSMQPSAQPSGQPTCVPTSSPTQHIETWGEVVWDRKRTRHGGMCEKNCSHHGYCDHNQLCSCKTGLNGDPLYYGADCSQRACPRETAWVGSVLGSNDLSPRAECANKGLCNRRTGECKCFSGYEGIACQRQICPHYCNGHGTCWPQRYLADWAGRIYETPWDSMKAAGCVCDIGYRGPTCLERECPTGTDPLGGLGGEAGRDCSGRGLCDSRSGDCRCFDGFVGERCQNRQIFF
jgi:hypothetical protein